MQKRGISNVVAVVLLILVIIAVVSLIALFLIPTIDNYIEKIQIKEAFLLEDFKVLSVEDNLNNLEDPNINIILKRGKTELQETIYEITEEITSAPVDVISITSLAETMKMGCYGDNLEDHCRHTDDKEECEGEVCKGTWEDKLEGVKTANKKFIDGILEYKENRVGLVGYGKFVYCDLNDDHPLYKDECHDLSKDKDSLKNKVDSWQVSDYLGICVCCAINSAKEKIISDKEDKIKIMILMSDGMTTITCSEQSTGDAKQNSHNCFWKLCRSYQRNIRRHSISSRRRISFSRQCR